MSLDWDDIFAAAHATLCYNDSDPWWSACDTAWETFVTFDLYVIHLRNSSCKNRWLLLPETDFNKGNGV